VKVLVFFSFVSCFRFYFNVVGFVLQKEVFLLKKKSLKQLDLAEKTLRLLML